MPAHNQVFEDILTGVVASYDQESARFSHSELSTLLSFVSQHQHLIPTLNDRLSAVSLPRIVRDCVSCSRTFALTKDTYHGRLKRNLVLGASFSAAGQVRPVLMEKGAFTSDDVCAACVDNDLQHFRYSNSHCNTNPPIILVEANSSYVNMFHNYSYDVVRCVPPPKHKHKDKSPELLLGIELETSIQIPYSPPNLRAEFESKTLSTIMGLHSILKGIPFVGLKQDGSIEGITAEGMWLLPFEMVSAPLPLEYHHFVWDLLFDHPEFGMFRSHTACGMHVHMDRASISPLTLAKMYRFMNTSRNSAFLTQIAGRGVNHSSRWSAQDDDDRFTAILTLPDNRYRAINLMPRRTAEIRIFASTTNKTEFLSRIEFCHALKVFCQTASMKTLGVDDFIRSVKDNKFVYPSLAQVLGLRKAPR